MQLNRLGNVRCTSCILAPFHSILAATTVHASHVMCRRSTNSTIEPLHIPMIVDYNKLTELFTYSQNYHTIMSSIIYYMYLINIVVNYNLGICLYFSIPVTLSQSIRLY